MLLYPKPYKDAERRSPGGDRKAQFAIVVIYDDSVAHWASGRLHPPPAAPASAPMVGRRPKRSLKGFRGLRAATKGSEPDWQLSDRPLETFGAHPPWT